MNDVSTIEDEERRTNGHAAAVCVGAEDIKIAILRIDIKAIDGLPNNKGVCR